MVAMVGVMLAMGADRSVIWLGSVGPVEVGVFVVVDPDPLSWIWTGILVGATMLCCYLRGEAASAETTKEQKKTVLLTQGNIRRADGEDPGICGYARCADRIQRRPQEVAAQGVGETGPDRHPALPFLSTNTAPKWDLNKSRQNVLSSQAG